MSLQLATKGKVNGALSNATRGVLYVFGALAVEVLTIVPDLIFRRVSVNKVFKKQEVEVIFRREDVYSGD